ncbi:MAG: FtsX-like permease family protein [Nitrososphaeria archaeon]|nr:FtsX-like permease family protein [Nitrososphaeria archaeon]
MRDRNVLSSVLAISLLVAILSSVFSIANYVSFQTSSLVKYSDSGTYLIFEAGSRCLSDSMVDVRLVGKLKNLSQTKYVFPQKTLSAKIIFSNLCCSVTFRFVEDVEAFLKSRGAYVNGTFAKGFFEANVGDLLAKMFSLNVGDNLTVVLEDKVFSFKTVGVFCSRAQVDSEILVSMSFAENFTGNPDFVSFIEFALKDDVRKTEAIKYIMGLLPENVMVVQTAQLKNFVQEINSQTLTLLNFWSITVYAAVALVSYIITVRYLLESSYTFAMLKAIGLKRYHMLTLILAYSTLISLAGSILGVALGLVGSQAASTFYRWMNPAFEVSPFLEVGQVLQILTLTLISSFFGCMYPSIKAMKTRWVEHDFS